MCMYSSPAAADAEKSSRASATELPAQLLSVEVVSGLVKLRRIVLQRLAISFSVKMSASEIWRFGD